MELKALYTITEVAELTGIDRRRVAYMVQKNLLDAIKIGKLYFVPLESLQVRPNVWQSIMRRNALVDAEVV